MPLQTTPNDTTSGGIRVTSASTDPQNAIPEDFDWRELMPEQRAVPTITHPFSGMSADEQQKLIFHLENTATQTDASTDAYKSLQLDTASTEGLAQLRNSFAVNLEKAIQEDPLIRKAATQWDTLGSVERESALNRINQIQSQTYGIKLDNHGYYTDRRPGAPAGENVGGRVGINVADRSFSAVAGTLIHENQHTFQRRLAAHMDSIPLNHPLRSAAEIFKLNLNLNRDGLTGTNNGWTHSYEPIENDARASQYDVRERIEKAVAHISAENASPPARASEAPQMDPHTSAILNRTWTGSRVTNMQPTSASSDARVASFAYGVETYVATEPELRELQASLRSKGITPHQVNFSPEGGFVVDINTGDYRTLKDEAANLQSAIARRQEAITRAENASISRGEGSGRPGIDTSHKFLRMNPATGVAIFEYASTGTGAAFGDAVMIRNQADLDRHQTRLDTRAGTYEITPQQFARQLREVERQQELDVRNGRPPSRSAEEIRSLQTAYNQMQDAHAALHQGTPAEAKRTSTPEAGQQTPAKTERNPFLEEPTAATPRAATPAARPQPAARTQQATRPHFTAAELSTAHVQTNTQTGAREVWVNVGSRDEALARQGRLKDAGVESGRGRIEGNSNYHVTLSQEAWGQIAAAHANGGQAQPQQPASPEAQKPKVATVSQAANATPQKVTTMGRIGGLFSGLNPKNMGKIGAIGIITAATLAYSAARSDASAAEVAGDVFKATATATVETVAPVVPVAKSLKQGNYSEAAQTAALPVAGLGVTAATGTGLISTGTGAVLTAGLSASGLGLLLVGGAKAGMVIVGKHIEVPGEIPSTKDLADPKYQGAMASDQAGMEKLAKAAETYAKCLAYDRTHLRTGRNAHADTIQAGEQMRSAFHGLKNGAYEALLAVHPTNPDKPGDYAGAVEHIQVASPEANNNQEQKPRTMASLKAESAATPAQQVATTADVTTAEQRNAAQMAAMANQGRRPPRRSVMPNTTEQPAQTAQTATPNTRTASAPRVSALAFS